MRGKVLLPEKKPCSLELIDKRKKERITRIGPRETTQGKVRRLFLQAAPCDGNQDTLNLRVKKKEALLGSD